VGQVGWVTIFNAFISVFRTSSLLGDPEVGMGASVWLSGLGFASVSAGCDMVAARCR
jgi:hypothetical protein